MGTGWTELLGPARELLLGGITPSMSDFSDPSPPELIDAVWGWQHRLVSGPELIERATQAVAGGADHPDWAWELAQLFSGEEWRLTDIVTAVDTDVGASMSERWRYRIVNLIWNNRHNIRSPKHSLHAIADMLGFPDDMRPLIWYSRDVTGGLEASWEQWLLVERNRLFPDRQPPERTKNAPE